MTPNNAADDRYLLAEKATGQACGLQVAGWGGATLPCTSGTLPRRRVQPDEGRLCTPRVGPPG